MYPNLKCFGKEEGIINWGLRYLLIYTNYMRIYIYIYMYIYITIIYTFFLHALKRIRRMWQIYFYINMYMSRNIGEPPITDPNVLVY